jgi:hypothetical protein
MSAEFSIREGHDIRELFEFGHATWAGNGAEALGLTGDVRPEDFEALAELVTDEDGEVSRHEAGAAGGLSLIEQMRRDGTL